VNEMAMGFVLINTAPGKEADVYRALKNVSEIKNLYPVFGDYDIVAIAEAKDAETLGRFIVSKIRSVPGITDTKTLTTGVEF